MAERCKPVAVRDTIMKGFAGTKGDLAVADIRKHVSETLGEDVPASPVYSYLNINTPELFICTGRGSYRLVRR